MFSEPEILEAANDYNVGWNLTRARLSMEKDLNDRDDVAESMYTKLRPHLDGTTLNEYAKGGLECILELDELGGTIPAELP